MNIVSKADHVREKIAEGNTRGHHCHWPGCDKAVPPASWGCKKHWFMLPAGLRSKIWRAYRPGQEDTKTPSRAYVEAAQEVRAWILANHPPQERLL